MFYLLALGSAAFYGAADFIGGIASRRANTIAIVLISQAAGLLMIALMLPFLSAEPPGPSDWIWGGLAGLTGGIGVAWLYRALAIGVMAVVAPVTAVCAVVVPVVAALAMGERPGLQASGGIVLAMIAIALVSQQAPSADETSGATGSRTANPKRGLGLAFASGVAIGFFFISLARTNADAGLWPLLAARIVSVSLFAVLALVYRVPLAMPTAVAATAIGGGLVDMLANLLYLLATREGPLTLVVTLTSLYPASTVMLARTVLGERLTARQWTGVACALVAIVTIVGVQ